MSVDLGFVDKSYTLLESRFFPSKIGGKPAWLDLERVPEAADIVCDQCNRPRYFLCQVYCPFNEKETAFHRTIFIFLCLSKNCFRANSNRNFIVLRNQLPRENVYFPATPPIEDVNWRPDINCGKFGVNLCDVCGIKSSHLVCNKCNQTFCCSVHKNIHIACVSIMPEDVCTLLPEYGVVIEPENDNSDDACSDNDSESDAESIGSVEIDGHSNLAELGCAEDDLAVEHFFSQCDENSHDEYFSNFKVRIRDHPKQVIRYARNTEPLWLTSKSIPQDSDVPACENCGNQREFEFQILPQLLNYLNLDSENGTAPGILDWGTLAVYTCRNSCDSGPAYKKEFLWKQDLVE